MTKQKAKSSEEDRMNCDYFMNISYLFSSNKIANYQNF